MEKSKIVMDCELYTYEAAIARYEREKHHSWLCRQNRLQKIRENQKEKRIARIKQKLSGMALVGVGIALTVFGIGEGIFLAIAGVALVATKNSYFD